MIWDSLIFIVFQYCRFKFSVFFSAKLGIFQQKDVPLQKGFVVQRIERGFPKPEIWVRFPSELLFSPLSFGADFLCPDVELLIANP